MNRVIRLVIVGAVAMGLALALARFDFSASSGGADGAPDEAIVAAASDFAPQDVRDEALIEVAPANSAIRFFRRRVATNPASYIDLTHLASQHLRAAKDLGSGDGVDGALAAAGRALEINPQYEPALVTYASALAANHRFHEAIEWAEKVAVNSRLSGDALAIIGDAHLALGDYDTAADFYRTLDAFSPGRASLSRQAHLAFLNGDTDGAVALAKMAAEAALEFGVTSHEAAWHLSAIGEFYLAKGEATTALKYFERARELAPDHVFALAGTAHSQWMSGDLAGSAATYEVALAQAPDDTGIMVELADVYGAMGRDDEAGALVAKAIEELRGSLGSSPELVRRELAQLLADGGEETELAVRLAREEVAERQDVYAYDLLAWALHRAGEHEEARTAVERAMALGTRDASISYHAGVIYSTLDMDDDALRALRAARDINPNFSLGDAAHAKKLLEELEGAS